MLNHSCLLQALLLYIKFVNLIFNHQLVFNMGGLLFKWFFISLIFLPINNIVHHPIFVSVTEIEHNAKENTLEISCKIFTDDFEKTLRSEYKTHIDLLDQKIKPAMDKIVNDYVQRHLKIVIDGKTTGIKYLGFEQIEEGIYSYYEANNIIAPKKIEVTDNVMLEYNPQQMNLVHVIVGGERKSAKLSGTDNKVIVQY